MSTSFKDALASRVLELLKTTRPVAYFTKSHIDEIVDEWRSSGTAKGILLAKVKKLQPQYPQ